MELEGNIALGALLVIAAIASWTDIRSRILPNWLVIVTFVSGLGFAVWSAGFEGSLYHLLHALAALVIGFALFGLKVWGAGDGKFFAAIAVWFPIDNMLAVILAITAVGFVVAVIDIVRNWGSLLSKSLAGIPYGVAIGLGAVLHQSRGYLF